MKKLLEFLVRSIVQNQPKVVVEEKEENGYLNLLIRAHQDDLKVIIGRKGRTIKALRDLVKIKALKEGKGVNLKVEG